MQRWRRSRAESGVAVVDFVLVSLVLVPLVLGLIQVGLTLYVRSTLAAAATEGARYGATLGHGPADGVARARAQFRGVVGERFVRAVSADFVDHAGLLTVEVRVAAAIPPLGLWGPAVSLEVVGHGVRETVP
ncbi:MAG: TadE family protein [Marmoricola sp.]|nr:TadE family protein [Marmoricola sp.]